MLVDIKDAELTDAQKIGAALCFQWVAVDIETGAYLLGGRGRAKYGNAPKWFLIVPHENCLFTQDGKWDREKMCRVGYERATFRAENLRDAIATGQVKLLKLLPRIQAKRKAVNET